MVMEGKSRGNITRQANKKVRRERILDIAKHLIASEGLEAFTFSQLATEAGVSTPTIHNLFGKKGDIVSELVAELIKQLELPTNICFVSLRYATIFFFNKKLLEGEICGNKIRSVKIRNS